MMLQFLLFLFAKSVYAICTVSQATIDPVQINIPSPAAGVVASPITTGLTFSGTWTFISCASATVTRLDTAFIDGLPYTEFSNRFGVLSLDPLPHTQIMVFRYRNVVLDPAVPTHLAVLSWTIQADEADYPVAGGATASFTVGLEIGVPVTSVSTPAATTPDPSGTVLTPSSSDQPTLPSSTTFMTEGYETTIILTATRSSIDPTLKPDRSRTGTFDPTSWAHGHDETPTGLSEAAIGAIAGIAGAVCIAAIVTFGLVCYKLRARNRNGTHSPVPGQVMEMEESAAGGNGAVPGEEKEWPLPGPATSTTALLHRSKPVKARPTSGSLRIPDAELLNSGRTNSRADYGFRPE